MSGDIKICIVSLLLLLAGLLSLVFSIALLTRKQNIPSNPYLSLFLSSVGLTLIHQFLLDTEYIKSTPILIGLTLPLEFIFPPTLYLYIRSMTNPEFSLTHHYGHFIPALVGILLLIPFYSLDFETKLNIIQQNFLSTELPGLFQDTFPLFVTATSIQFLIYFVLYFKLLSTHSKNIPKLFSYRKHINLSWIRNFLIFTILFLIAMLSIRTYYYSGNITWFDEVIYIFSAIAISYIGVMGLLQKCIYDKNHIKDSILIIKNTRAKNSDFTLTDNSLDKIIDPLKNTMEVEKPFLNNEFSLFALADNISITPELLSLYLSHKKNMTFYDYINQYRVEYAKQLLIDCQNNNRATLDIADRSGFKSNQYFKKEFKKSIGISPMDFKI